MGSSAELTLKMQSCKLMSIPEQTDDFDVDFDFGGNVDMDNFAQVLDMDDDEDSREFSRSIVFGFFAQAVDTFSDMDTDM
jgi:osomolarity two-component system phosphorelay intermediate protein YPD1